METIGDYAILKPLGQGSFGSVYLAEHRFLKKPFVLKILAEEFTQDPSFPQRWERKMQEVMTLHHPSLVKVHSAFCVEGKCAVVMDPFIDAMGEGMHLGRFLELRGKSLTEDEIEKLLRELAETLDSLHASGFHGNLKLTSLLVGKTETGISLHLSGTGLYSLLQQEKMLGKFFSKLGGNSQHLSFLAPEQKKLQPADAKADIYAFGVIAYYLLMREFPEGYFPFPSECAPHYKLHWDLLLKECLHRDPSKRSLGLVQKMELIRTSTPSLPWNEVEKKVEDALQMSFAFSGKEEEAPSLFTPQSPLKPVLKPQEIQRPTYDPDPATVFQKDLTVSRYQPTKVEFKDIDPLLTEMVVIPGGHYSRGSAQGARDEMPRHAILVKSFALDTHPITNEQFVRFLLSMGGEKDSNNNDIIRLKDSRIKRSGGKLLIESGYNKHPVVGVTWYGAVAYAKWVGKRLPTEAEWEIACCGGMDNCNYPTGDDVERSQANFFSSDTTAVMSYPCNSYGLYDMVGNVYEWCNDWYAYNYYENSMQEPENPQGPPQGVYRVLRGGCWKSLKEDLRCSHRHRNNPGAVNGTYGFRCAADVS